MAPGVVAGHAEFPENVGQGLIANYAIHGTALGPGNKQISGDVPGLDADGFRAAAESAKENCPVSQALKAVPITLTIE